MKKIYLQYIKDFSKISISNLCKELGINRENILKGKASEETTKKLYDEIKRQLKLIDKKKRLIISLFC